MIVVEKLTKRFGDRDAVQNISFNVDRGEILGFLGPNGAGKTTTMRVLTCYFPPTSGRAEVAGFDVMKDSLQVRRHVGYMPENVPLYQDMPVESYLHFVADVKGVSGRERRKHVEEVMSETSLTEVRDYPISKISRGFRQRVGLAQAIVGKPDVLILDEPTVGLDPKQIIEIRSLIRSLASRATVILSTHIMQEVEALCNRVIIIDKGVIREVDTVDNLRTKLAQGQLVELLVRGAELGALAAALKPIEGVSSVVKVGDDHGAQRFNIEIKGQVDVREQIASCIVKANWGLLELHRKSDSLEDIFIRVVTKDVVAEGDEYAAAVAGASDAKDKEAT